MEHKHTRETATRTITNTGGRIKGRFIFHKRPGLKVLSAIDYMVNHLQCVWKKQ